MDDGGSEATEDLFALLLEEQPPANSPERRGAEHVALGKALRDVVGQVAAHVMDQQRQSPSGS